MNRHLTLFLGAGVFFFVAYVVYAMAVAIPERTVQSAKAVIKDIDRDAKRVLRHEEHFTTLMTSKDKAFYAPYAKREKWSNDVAKAKEAIAKAKGTVKATITPILDRDHEDDERKLLNAISSIKRDLASALKLSHQPLERSAALKKSSDNKEKNYTSAQKILSDNLSTQSVFTAYANKMSLTHKAKSSVIGDMVKQVDKHVVETKAHFSMHDAEYRNKAPDFAVLTDSFSMLKTTKQHLDAYSKKHRKKLSELNDTYVKVLVDQTVKYEIVVGRSTWCESDGCGNGDTISYPKVEVDADTFAYFESFNGSIATEKSDWGSIKRSIKADRRRWDALRLSTDYRRNSGHRYAEYWIDNTIETTKHKYVTIKNDKAQESVWQNVSSEYFWANYENLGMALATKPVGEFMADVNNIAEPAALALVAAPILLANGDVSGKNDHGEWRSNGSGGWFFWFSNSHYRSYGNYYDYDDYDDYRSRKRNKPYYGKSNKFGTSGTATQKHSKYKGSTFVKQNPSIYSKRAGSARGAGTSSRGKGLGNGK